MRSFFVSILFIIFSLFLVSCGKSDDKNISNVDHKQNTQTGSLVNAFSGGDITFNKCESLSDFSENRSEYFNSDDVKLLVNASNIPYNEESLNFSAIIQEYCTNGSGLYILYAQDKLPIFLARFNKNNGKFEITKHELKYFNNIYPHNIYVKGNTEVANNYRQYIKNKASVEGFGKRNGNNIEFMTHGVELNKHIFINSDIAEKIVPKQYFNYCSNGSISTCFFDISYNFDFVKNIIKETKICPYGFNKNNEVYQIYKCFEIKE